jgi:hypothetical protein
LDQQASLVLTTPNTCASTQHALRASCVSLRLAQWPSTQFRIPADKFSMNKFFANKVLQVTMRVYKNALQASEALQPYFKESKCISRTSLRHGVLTRFAVKDFFSYESLNARNQEKIIPMSYLRGIITYVPQPRIPFFCSRVAVFTSNLSRLKYSLLHCLFYEEAMCKGSTKNRLLYAAKAVP